MNKANKLSPIEAIERNRRINLIGFIIAFSSWQLGQIVTLNFSDSIDPELLFIFQLLMVVGSLGWIGFSYFLYRTIRLIKQHPELSSQLNDERSSLIRIRAMAYGFIYTLGAASLFFGGSFLIDAFSANFHFSGSFVAQSIMLIGIESAWISFLIMDSKE
ncbi:MAG TPA: hypothetical protein ENJ60_02550 [Aeromonadales bacterium]|nr:hypothetical protein [Aeromonadales bacterium]